MDIDEFAPNLSFFSNGMDPEYSVIGRVARRVGARAMRERYGANTRSQQLKYHIQTSGRSLHAREIQFNDIRTTNGFTSPLRTFGPCTGYGIPGSLSRLRRERISLREKKALSVRDVSVKALKTGWWRVGRWGFSGRRTFQFSKKCALYFLSAAMRNFGL